MFRKILVPLDESAFSEQALPVVGALARRVGAEVELVVVDDPYPNVLKEDPYWQTVYQERDLTYLDRVARQFGDRFGIPVRFSRLEAPVVQSICYHADATGADLIALSTHGRTGFSRAWLGSVADGVIRHSQGPVLLIRAAERRGEEPADAHDRFARVVVPLENAAEVAPTLAHAFAVAGPAAKYLLLHAVPSVPAIPPVAGTPFTVFSFTPDVEATARLIEGAKRFLDTGVATLSAMGAKQAEVFVPAAEYPARAIVDFVRKKNADLVVMNSHGRGVSRLLLGSVGDKVLRGTKSAVLVCHKAP
ncbi:MAG TPA: universal stress protein [Gemmatimonadaceae bacterium]|nr:universal stress protein [Gemmatimonadaceae bacterium]